MKGRQEGIQGRSIDVLQYRRGGVGDADVGVLWWAGDAALRGVSCPAASACASRHASLLRPCLYLQRTCERAHPSRRWFCLPTAAVAAFGTAPAPSHELPPVDYACILLQWLWLVLMVWIVLPCVFTPFHAGLTLSVALRLELP